MAKSADGHAPPHLPLGPLRPPARLSDGSGGPGATGTTRISGTGANSAAAGHPCGDHRARKMLATISKDLSWRALHPLTAHPPTSTPWLWRPCPQLMLLLPNKLLTVWTAAPMNTVQKCLHLAWSIHKK